MHIDFDDDRSDRRYVGVDPNDVHIDLDDDRPDRRYVGVDGGRTEGCAY